MVRNAQAIMEATTSVHGIRSYVRELLAKYTKRVLGYVPTQPDERAVRFACEETTDEGLGACRVPAASAGGRRALRGVRCHFRGTAATASEKFDTLHDAAQALLHEQEQQPPSRPWSQGIPATTVASRRATAAAICSSAGRTNARLANRWCFDFNSEKDCHAHTVPGYSSSSSKRGSSMAAPRAGCAQRHCVWRPALYTLALDEDRLLRSTACRLGVHAKGGGGGACVAMCPCDELCNGTRGVAL